MNRTALVLACSLFCACSGLALAQVVGPLASTAATACTGTPLAQTPVDVTAKISQVGAGVTVTQVTSLQSNWNTYSDIQAFSPLTGVLTYNSFSPDIVAVANLDGTNAQTISGPRLGTETYVTVDGKFVYFEGQNPNQTGDLYAVPISQSGACRLVRLSNLNWVPQVTPSSLVISTSGIDPATGKNVIAFSEGNILHRVLDDGTALPDLNLPDPENANVFHRIRLNPVFPNIMWYKRDAPLPNPNGVAEPEIWVIDLNSPNTVYSLTGSLAADHDAWSPDGTQIGYHDENANWYVAQVLNPDGTFALANGAFTSTKIAKPGPYAADSDYCVWAPDGSVFVCTSGAGVTGTPIYLMSLDGTKGFYLTATDSTGTSFDGIPKAGFLDMQHIMFSSDRTGIAQVYVASGFTTSNLVNLIYNNSFFVNQLYLDLLGRTADSAGLSYWVGQLASGQVSRAQAAYAFFASPEFESNGLFIISAYLAVLGRNADYAGWLYNLQNLWAGQSPQSVINSFIQSTEFQQTYGTLTNTAFIQLVYQNVLARPPDSAGLNYWVGQLNSGATTRAGVMYSFSVSSEYQARIQNEALSTLMYLGFLRRSPDPTGVIYWTTQLNDGISPATVVNAFITSSEYLGRFWGQ